MVLGLITGKASSSTLLDNPDFFIIKILLNKMPALYDAVGLHHDSGLECHLNNEKNGYWEKGVNASLHTVLCFCEIKLKECVRAEGVHWC